MYKLLIHVDSDESAILELALGNITNYLNAFTEDTECRVTLLANARAVRQFVKGNPAEATVQNLAARGVTFALCANAMRSQGLTEENISAGCTVVPAGIVELVHLQNEGYAYVKP